MPLACSSCEHPWARHLVEGCACSGCSCPRQPPNYSATKELVSEVAEALFRDPRKIAAIASVIGHHELAIVLRRFEDAYEELFEAPLSAAKPSGKYLQ